jgi:hypothetical protein
MTLCLSPVVFVESVSDIRFRTSGSGEFDGVELAKVFSAAIYFDMGFPLLVAFMPMNPGDAARASGGKGPVSLVLGARNLAQVRNSIVCLDAINVVDLIGRPRSSVEKPSNSMSEINPAKNGYDDVSGAPQTGHLFVSIARVPTVSGASIREHLDWPRKPEQLSGFRFGSEEHTDFFVG